MVNRKSDRKNSEWLASLREKAEALAAKSQTPEADFQTEDLNKLVHELQVYQAELEIQNTELAEAQNRLEESRNKYYELFDLAPVGYFLLDTSGMIQEVNLTGCDLLGMERSALKQKPLVAFVAPRQHGNFFNHLHQVRRTAHRVRCELEMLPKGGKIFHARVESTPADQGRRDQGGILLTLTDITTEKKAKASLDKSEKEKQAILDSMTERVAYIDADFRIIWANRTAAELAGATPEKLVGKYCHEIWQKTAVPCGVCPVQKSWNQAEVHEEEITTPDGRVWRVRGYPVLNQRGEVTGVVETGLEITEQKRIEQERKKLEIQLRQAQKMEAIGTLAGGIAHDFNNILSLILGYAELSLDDLPENSPTRINVQEIYRAGLRAKNLVTQILTFARQGEKVFSAVRIGPIVKEALKLLRASLPSTIDIRTEIQENLGFISADPTQIHQILLNLCTNSKQSLEQVGGGILNIRLEETEPTSEEIEAFPALEPDRYLRLTVADNGKGIPGEILDKIFDPYFTTKEVGKGTGLGLSMVHGIVQDHKAHIAVRSGPETGATFVIHFPLVAAEAENPDPRPPGELRALGYGHILMVDDEAPIIAMQGRILENLGYRVTAVTGSTEALSLFQKNPQNFDLVITDMTMPVMTGDRLAVEIKKIRPDVPVVLCTGFSEKITEERTRELGIDRFLLKPISVGEMSEVIESLLNPVSDKSPSH